MTWIRTSYSTLAAASVGLFVSGFLATMAAGMAVELASVLRALVIARRLASGLAG